MRELQPDISGYMASLGTTNEPLNICPSHQRSLIYGAMMYAGSVKAEVDRLDKRTDPVDMAQALRAAVHHSETLVEILAQFVRADFVACLPGATDLSEEDWGIALTSFFHARSETFVALDGTVIFEPHEPHDPDGREPAGVAS